MNVITIPFLLFLICSTSGDVKVEKIADPVVHGEGPHWDSEKQVLFYVDIKNQTVNKFDPKTGSVTHVHVDGGPVTLVVPDKFDDTRFVLGRGLDIVSMTWDGESPEPSSLKVLASVDADKPENRFNDGKVDASGRLWAGTMGPENPDLRPFQGSLYSFDWSDEFKPVSHVSPVSVSNGIAWNKNDSLMYYIDSPTRVVYVFDFDIVTGNISNQQELFSFEKNNITGLPDGMAIDENDNLWVAVYRGSCILNIDTEDGTLLKRIDFPVTQVTSCAFGGDNLEDLYVTTSKLTLSEEDIEKQPLAGALFKGRRVKEARRAFQRSSKAEVKLIRQIRRGADNLSVCLCHPCRGRPRGRFPSGHSDKTLFTKRVEGSLCTCSNHRSMDRSIWRLRAARPEAPPGWPCCDTYGVSQPLITIRRNFVSAACTRERIAERRRNRCRTGTWNVFTLTVEKRCIFCDFIRKIIN